MSKQPERRKEEREPGPYTRLCDRAYTKMREEVVKENVALANKAS